MRDPVARELSRWKECATQAGNAYKFTWMSSFVADTLEEVQVCRDRYEAEELLGRLEDWNPDPGSLESKEHWMVRHFVDRSREIERLEQPLLSRAWHSVRARMGSLFRGRNSR